MRILRYLAAYLAMLSAMVLALTLGDEVTFKFTVDGPDNIAVVAGFEGENEVIVIIKAPGNTPPLQRICFSISRDLVTPNNRRSTIPIHEIQAYLRHLNWKPTPIRRRPQSQISTLSTRLHPLQNRPVNPRPGVRDEVKFPHGNKEVTGIVAGLDGDIVKILEKEPANTPPMGLWCYYVPRDKVTRTGVRSPILAPALVNRMHDAETAGLVLLQRT